jgi:5-methylcytosine-specific restriction endonuclease McrA
MTASCRQCSEPITAPRGRRGPASRYCGARCRDRHRRAPRLGPAQPRGRLVRLHTCQQCGGEFRSRALVATCCSTRCSALLGHAERPREPKPCAECCTSFAGTERAKFCSDRCSARWRKRTRNGRLKNRIDAEKFSPREVFDRDGWTCQLCGGPCDPSVRVPSLQAATLDHIIPVSLGGSHTRANVRCAHYSCNSRRGARDVPEAA